MMPMKTTGPGIFITKGDFVTWGRAEVNFLKKEAFKTPRRRARLCAHKRNSDKVHEMLIVLAKGSYIRPHKHRAKVESFHLIEGRVDVVLFDRSGNPQKVIRMGSAASGRVFYYRFTDNSFHTLIIRSSTAVFHETTNGPFVPSLSTLFARWSPDESDPDAVRTYQRHLEKKIKGLMKI